MDWRYTEAEMARADGHAVYLARTESDLLRMEELWRAVYGRELGWLRPEAKAMYVDEYHAHSTYLLAVVEDNVVGTIRMVRDSVRGLPVERFVSIDKIRGEGDRRLMECQRLMLLPEYRNKRMPRMPFGVVAAMFKGCLHWCVRSEVTHVVADLFANTPTTPMASLQALGFVETGLSFVDTELDEPDVSVALLLRIGELFSRCYRSDSAFYRYLISPDDVVDVYEG